MHKGYHKRAKQNGCPQWIQDLVANDKRRLAVCKQDKTFQLNASGNKWIGKCAYCNRTLRIHTNGSCVDSNKSRNKQATLDHIVPKTFGGTDCLTNLVIACYRCNHKKNEHEQGHLNILNKGFKRWAIRGILAKIIRYRNPTQVLPETPK